MEKQGFDQWALVELMGHQRIAGRVTEEEIGGSKFVRVDVPEMEGVQPLTKFLGPSSIYAITPVSEAAALRLASGIKAAPVSIWDAKRMVELDKKELPPPSTRDEDDEEEVSDDEIGF